MSELKQLRIEKKLTQQEACEILGVSLRTYKTYENDISKASTLKYKFMLEYLKKHTTVDEEHGILTLDDIKMTCNEIFNNYPVNYCILFGSYAKGIAKETSDVDLLISTEITGLRFFGLIEELRNKLNKKVDLLDINQLTNNPILINEILKDGIKIYANHKG